MLDKLILDILTVQQGFQLGPLSCTGLLGKNDVRSYYVRHGDLGGQAAQQKCNDQRENHYPAYSDG